MPKEGDAPRNADVSAAPSWESFVLRHSPLIRRTVARILHDFEDAEDAYVAVLERLQSGALEQLRPEQSEAAWLTVLSTRVAIDGLRRRYGRLRWPEALQQLGAVEQRVFELCHRQQLDFRQTLERLKAEGTPLEVEELASAVHRIDALLTPVARRQLIQLHRAESVGRLDWRLAQVLEIVEDEMRDRAEKASPEWKLLRRQAEALRERLVRLIEGLDPRDQELLQRYYHEDESAAEVDAAMGFGGARSVHSSLERLRKKLRLKILGSETDESVRDKL